MRRAALLCNDEEAEAAEAGAGHGDATRGSPPAAGSSNSSSSRAPGAAAGHASPHAPPPFELGPCLEAVSRLQRAEVELAAHDSYMRAKLEAAQAEVQACWAELRARGAAAAEEEVAAGVGGDADGGAGGSGGALGGAEEGAAGPGPGRESAPGGYAQEGEQGEQGGSRAVQEGLSHSKHSKWARLSLPMTSVYTHQFRSLGNIALHLRPKLTFGRRNALLVSSVDIGGACVVTTKPKWRHFGHFYTNTAGEGRGEAPRGGGGTKGRCRGRQLKWRGTRCSLGQAPCPTAGAANRLLRLP